MKSLNNLLGYSIALVLGILCSMLGSQEVQFVADKIAYIFVDAIKWLSLPIILLAILTTTSGLENAREMLSLGKQVLKYTVLTTSIAALLALSCFIVLNPALPLDYQQVATVIEPRGFNVFSCLLIATLIITFTLSIIILQQSPSKRYQLHLLIEKAYNRVMYVIQLLLKIMPLAIWAFVVIFIQDLDVLTVQNLSVYLLCIIIANLLQALIVLPSLLMANKISPLRTAKAMLPALIVAFWSKSSSLALPVAMECAETRLNITPKIARFSLPLCTTINMNACAAFILITVLFVTQSHGIVFDGWNLLLWTLIATVAAIGNAGVPMGCYTLTCALLSMLGVPLSIMGYILPFYAMIDMLESVINVWSDACVTKLVDR